MIVTGDQLRAYYELSGYVADPDAQFIGRWEGERLLGVVAVWNFDGHGCEAGWFGEPGWLSRGFLRFVFGCIFGQWGCQRITGRIDDSNVVAVEQSKRLGFVLEGTLRQAHPGGDVLIFGMLKSECRYG